MGMLSIKVKRIFMILGLGLAITGAAWSGYGGSAAESQPAALAEAQPLLSGLGVEEIAQPAPGAVGVSLQADHMGDPLPTGAIMRLGSMRWRPSGKIEYLAFAPDGKKLASWHDEHSTTAALTIWEVPTGRELRRVEVPGLGILFWTWLADGRGIAVVQSSKGPYLWEFSRDDSTFPPDNTINGRRLEKKIQFPAPDNEHFASFALSADGKYLAGGKAGSEANKARDIVVWELVTQRKVSELPKSRRLTSCANNCNDLFFTPDNRKLVVFGPPKDMERQSKKFVVTVFDTATGKELRRLSSSAPLAQGSRMSSALSNDYLALGLEDEQGTVLLWDIDKGQDKEVLTGHKKKSSFSGYGVSALAFTPDGKKLITAGRDGAVKIWDVTAGAKELRTISNAYPGWIEALAVTLDGTRLACSGQGGIIRHWDLSTGTELHAQPGHGDRVTSVGVTSDGATALTVCADNQLRIWDLATGRQRHALDMSSSESGWPHAILAPDGCTVVISTADKMKTWSLVNGMESNLPQLAAEVKAGLANFAADGKTLLVWHTNSVTLLDWPSGKLRRRFTLPEPAQKPGEASCDAVTISPDGHWLASMAHRFWYREERGMRFGYGADGVLDLWNATTGEHVHRLVDGGGTGRAAIFTADGELLFEGGGKLHPRDGDEIPLVGELHLIDPLTGRLQRSFEPAPRLPGASYRYNAAIGIAPNGRSVLCAGNDGVIHIYETATGKIRRSLQRHRDYVTGLAFTADGRRLLTGSIDLTALVWDISLVGYSSKNTAPLNPDDQLKAWDKLLEADARISYEAMTILSSHPKITVALIRTKVTPATTGPDDATLDRLVAELGAAKFAVRERTTRELDQLGEAAVPGMRQRLAKTPPLETHLRIMRFLNKHDPTTLTPLHLREIRALEILEQVDTPESRSVLTLLAQGDSNARLTRAAVASLARYKGRVANVGK